MSRASRRRAKQNRRDTTVISSLPRLVGKELLENIQAPLDRRFYNPLRFKSSVRKFTHQLNPFNVVMAKTKWKLIKSPIRRMRAQITGADKRGYDILKLRDWAVNPRENLVCLRRKIRAEVLHAFRKTGKGVKRKKPTFTFDSTIKCRR